MSTEQPKQSMANRKKKAQGILCYVMCWRLHVLCPRIQNTLQIKNLQMYKVTLQVFLKP